MSSEPALSLSDCNKAVTWNLKVYVRNAEEEAADSFVSIELT